MNDRTNNQKAVSLNIDQREALILFELLSREIGDQSGNRIRKITQHDSEIWALNELLCALECELAEPFDPEYNQLLKRAIAAVEQECGPWPE